MARIDNNLNSAATVATNKRVDTKSADANVDKTSSITIGNSDAVSLSSEGKAASLRHQDMSSSPAYDMAKVSAIKEAIANGSYKVDPEKLANNIIRFERELNNVN